ncbi:MAG: sulfotransferase [Planctomycetota bacterium]
MNDSHRPPDRSRAFFIVGTGRCGSTLLQVTLDCHPAFSVAPETFFFCHYDPAMIATDPLPNAQAIDAYLDRLLADPRYEQLGLDTDAFRRDVHDGRHDAASIFWYLAWSLAPKPGIRWLGEKSPHHERFVRRIHACFPDARFIHIHRDPRDVVASLIHQHWWPTTNVLDTAIYCRHVIDRQTRLASDLGPDKYLTIKYERLVTTPREELERLCAFFGEPFDDAMLRQYERERTGYVGAEAGHKALTLKPIQASRIGRYREILTPQQVRTVERAMGPVMDQLGYDVDAEIGEDRAAWMIADGLGHARRWAKRQARSVRKRCGFVRKNTTTSQTAEAIHR